MVSSELIFGAQQDSSEFFDNLMDKMEDEEINQANDNDESLICALFRIQLSFTNTCTENPVLTNT